MVCIIEANTQTAAKITTITLDRGSVFETFMGSFLKDAEVMPGPLEVIRASLHPTLHNANPLHYAMHVHQASPQET